MKACLEIKFLKLSNPAVFVKAAADIAVGARNRGGTFSRFQPRSSLLVLAYFENSDDCSKGSQEPDKQLTSPEVMALSNSSD